MRTSVTGEAPPRSAPAAALISILQSPVTQAIAVVAATIATGVLHWHNDGLWFQGDAPRHAANGLFFWDLLASHPADPLTYTLRYYARYPVITPVAYPPLFYLLEGLAFHAVAPSPYVAKVLVLTCAAVVGLYTTAWGRRWISPTAGWAGPSVVLLPVFVQYSNAVLLNVPATALGFAALYHLRIWQETAAPRHGRLFIVLAAVMVLTYYPAAIALVIGTVWMLFWGRRVRTISLWLIPALLVLLAIATATLLPTFLARHLPVVTRWLRVYNWMFYVRGVRAMTGLPWLILGVSGLAVAFLTARFRREAIVLALAYLSVVVCLSSLPAQDPRYAMLLAPATVLAAFIGAAAVADIAGRQHLVAALAPVGAVTLAVWSAVNATVPVVSGIDRVAVYLRDHASRDTVLYSGQNDGVFTFYMRAFDPDFERRVILSSKLLYRSEERRDFIRAETPYATSAAEVVSMIQRECACPWVAVEIGPESALPVSERLLRRALEGPDFERIQSFPVMAGAVVRVDLYKFRLPFEPAAPVDLSFPSFSARVFRGIEPIERRP